MIFLDVDEVLADWSGAALRLLGVDGQAFKARWFAEAPEIWNMFDVPGFPIPRDEAWRQIDAAGASYWSTLEPLPWAHELIEACRAIAPTVLLTKPSSHPSSAQGKLAWMQAQFGGRGFSDYLIGPPKHAVARPGAVLVDDHPANCAAFVEHGGQALLFPAVGNRMRGHLDDPLAVVLPKLRALYGR
ncbi:hypothetical protein G6O69_15930 [Pseudenhygromyxa sp. WMMC2535]|uniref:5' nucleotidase, NT5C type n=1 Tax=Pseudenhygromyxa sp. WMMC2535 TaxID=2712867 RepID=UPI001552D5F2|nr:hypothetical protein [Pseudenhygromyxa sp. WMMC2535]NVB39333.1 hypothetical protein [Pseudenhygromyxa sp. WMMC2535]